MQATFLRTWVGALTLCFASPAAAVQPLADFLRSAQRSNPSVQQAQAQTQVGAAAASVAAGRLLPGVALRASYGRNQYETAVSLPASVAGGGTDNGTGSSGGRRIVMLPYNQVDGTATVTLSLLNLTDLWRARGAGLQHQAFQADERHTALQVEGEIAQLYFQWVADVGLCAASQRALEVARTNLEIAKNRFQAGKTAAIDVDRATAEVERQVQQKAAAEYALAVDGRSLQSLSGLAPAITDEERRGAWSAPELIDDLHAELPLTSFRRDDEELPLLRAAILQRRAQEKQTTAQKLALVPTLTGSFTERATNAVGFLGRTWLWQSMVWLSWNVDMSTLGQIELQEAQLRVAQAREETLRRAAHDAIFRAWQLVQMSIARSRSARQQAHVSRRAADLARERYDVGATTHLELLQAERDAFFSDVNQVQADADLANARAQLRLVSGQSLRTAQEEGS